MVFFTCSHCGESVKKAAVAKHYRTKCKNQTPFLTCVDCLKDFKGTDYEAHIKCFTEEEKYSAKGFVPKQSANKGERKQKAWSVCIQAFALTGNLKEDEKKLLEAISKHDNIPRKKQKFINFLKSTARSIANNTELVDRIWTKLENYFKEVNPESQKNSEANGVDEKKGDNQNQKKKRKQDEMAGGDKNEDGQKSKKKKKKHSGEESEKAGNGGDTGNKNKKNKKRPNENKGEEVNGKDQPKSKKAKKSKENGGGNGSNDKENVSQKKNKGEEKEKSTEGDATDDVNGADDTFDWNGTIMKILNQNGAKNQMKVNKLQKKVLKMYGEAKGCEIDDNLAKKFSKKLCKMDTIKLNGDYVTIKT